MKDSTQYPIAERNLQLLEFFTSRGYDARLVGDMNQPKVVIDRSWSPSCFVQNRLLHFTTKPFGGKVIYTVNLNFCHDVTREKIDSVISDSETRQMWWICTENELLHFSHCANGTAHFTAHCQRWFFDRTKAEEMFDWLTATYNIPILLQTNFDN